MDKKLRRRWDNQVKQALKRVGYSSGKLALKDL